MLIVFPILAACCGIAQIAISEMTIYVSTRPDIPDEGNACSNSIVANFCKYIHIPHFILATLNVETNCSVAFSALVFRFNAFKASFSFVETCQRIKK